MAPKSKEVLDNSDEENKSWELLIVHRKKLNDTQRTFGTLFYWAGYYGDKQLVDKFLGLGLSPFLKLFHHKNVIDGCIEGY
jgi:hypothetical protein